jgi:hypothetical protein
MSGNSQKIGKVARRGLYRSRGGGVRDTKCAHGSTRLDRVREGCQEEGRVGCNQWSVQRKVLESE